MSNKKTVVLQKITVVRELLDDGQEAWHAKFYDHGNPGSGTMPLLDGLGLLSAASIDLQQKCGMIPMPPGQEQP